MAVLMSPYSGAPEFLGARHLVGRSEVANIVVRDPAVSGEHAVFTWTGRVWELRDLGSRNGTWVDDRQLGPGERLPLELGNQIAFGDRKKRWELLSAAPPTVAGWTDGLVVEGEGRLLALPSEEDPQVVVELDPVRGWQMIREGESSPVRHGEMVTIGRTEFTISIPAALAPVPMTAELQEISITENTTRRMKLDFGVSADEEYIELTADVGGTSRRLAPRVHHYLLLVLARRRLADAAEGVAESEQGWVYTNDLRKGLRITANQYYVMTHRLRREVEDLGVVDASRLVEKRTTSRQVRIGVPDLTVRSL
ncbi:MAG: FHA domain-containing protein [Deltaproteobacteria bacterium]|nr:FHA domain-containing protein [Deltaproteobacteria bacterium]